MVRASRTRNLNGIVNSDWFVTTGGDGFRSQVDPVDANTIYSESQYGVLVRHDKPTGQELVLQPLEGKGEPPLRWKWDSPVIISPHRIRGLFCRNKLFRSDDRGDTWKAISGDLTRQWVATAPVIGKVRIRVRSQRSGWTSSTESDLPRCKEGRGLV